MLTMSGNTVGEAAAPVPGLTAKRRRLAVLDPGHHAGHNRGGAAGYYEGDWMLVYARYLETALAKRGWRILLTRYRGNDLGLVQRGRLAARKKADLFYSLHSNACGDPRVRRVTAFYSVDLPGDRALALALAKAVAKEMGCPSFHAVTRASQNYFSRPDPSRLEDYYTVIDAAQDGGVPHVVLLEHDFHTNPDVCRWLVNRENLKRMAEAEAEVIDGMIYVEQPPVSSQ